MDSKETTLLEQINTEQCPYFSFSDKERHKLLKGLQNKQLIKIIAYNLSGGTYVITPAGKAALGISDEPQAAVEVETPAAQDSEYQVGDDVSIKYTTDTYYGIVRDVTSDSISIIRYNQAILSFLLSDVIVTLVSRPTIAPVAITDDSAADNTPSEQKREIEQPSASEPALSVAAYDALLYIYNVERGLISVQACDSLTRAGLITPICMQGSQWLVKSNDAGREYVEKYLLAKEAQPSASRITFDGVAVNELSNSRLATLYYVIAETSDDKEEIAVLQSEMERRNLGGWVADALATVDVTSEAAVNDDYLPPTVDEDNDDLPFSDLGEDEKATGYMHPCHDCGGEGTEYNGAYTVTCRTCWGTGIYEIEESSDKDETIASLEARVLSLEYALARIAEYGWTENLMDDILKMQSIAVGAITKQAVR